MKLSTLGIVTLLGMSFSGLSVAQPARAIAQPQRQFRVGQRVEYVDGGKWFKAVITNVATDAEVANFGPYHVYRVHSLGYTTDSWAGDYTDARAQLRASGAGPTEPVPGGESNDAVLIAMRGGASAKVSGPAAKHYNCSVGNSLTITGSGTYTDADGTRGRYTFNASSWTLTFAGGSFDGQRARYEMSYGLARLHILGPSGRAVIDCD